MNEEEIISSKEKELIIPDDSFVFVSLGGITEIGLNCFLYGYKGKWLVVDCGIGFAGEGLPGVDVLLPNPDFIAQHKKDIVGLVITHGHEDHIGAIPYLWQDLQCPIYATPFTAELIEDKLDEAGLLSRVELNVVAQGSVLDLSPFEVEFISVSHSIPEPNMLAIRTEKGTVVHSGDWKFENASVLGQPIDIKTLKKVGKDGVLALVCDSTNIFTQTETRTEEDVRQALILLFKEMTSRIFITCFASNVTRMESIALAAKEAGRKVCLMGRSLWRIDDAARASGYLKGTPQFLTEDEAHDIPDDQIVYICTGSQGEPFSALSKLATTKPLSGQIQLTPKDVVIFSSRIIPGNELAIASLQKRLLMTGCRIITERDALVHVSGHPAQSNMRELYSFLKPKIAIPVHGEPLHILEHKKLAIQWGAGTAMAIEEGDVLELNDGEPEILGEVPVGCLAVDGKQILSLSSDVIRKRRKMVDAGSVVLTVVIDKNGQLLGEPQISSFGLLDNPDEKEELFKKIKKTIDDSSPAELSDNDRLKENIRLTLRHFITEMYGKKPLLEIHLFKI